MSDNSTDYEDPDEVAERRQRMVDAVEANPYITTPELADLLGVSRGRLHSDAHFIRRDGLKLCYLSDPETGSWGWLLPEAVRDQKRYAHRRDRIVFGHMDMVQRFIRSAREEHPNDGFLRLVERTINRAVEDLEDLLGSGEIEGLAL
ncbi:hypothetical protein ACI8AA_02610 [Geodermatophilus sp. SYSU D01180]